MPDYISGLKPVVRRVSATQKDIVSRFERNSLSGGSLSSSVASSGASTPVSRSRAGSVKKTSLGETKKTKPAKIKDEKERQLEEKLLDWIETVTREKHEGSFEDIIKDAVILSKVMTNIVFNSVPKEEIDVQWGCHPERERAKSLIREIMRYGIKDVFEPEDLLEKKNIPKVTRCIDELRRRASIDEDSLLPPEAKTM